MKTAIYMKNKFSVILLFGVFTAFWATPSCAQSAGDSCTGTDKVISARGGAGGVLICNGTTLELLETVRSNPPRVGIGTANPNAALTVSGGGVSTGTSGNTDLAGRLTLVLGTKTYNFTGSYASPPVCSVSSTSALPTTPTVTTTASSLTISVLGGLNTDTYNYISIARN
jgi:hypothetical protein